MLFPPVTVLLVFLYYSLIPEISSNASSSQLREQLLVQRFDGIENHHKVISSLVDWQKRQRNLSRRRRKRSEVKVCYPEIGCFYESGYIDILPNSPEEINTKFLFYNSKKFRGDTPLLDISAQNISSLWKWTDKAVNVSAPTKVIIHGFGSSCSNIWVYEMRSALMSAEECNVICVDWESGAPIPNYVQASANTRIVGKQVAMLISGLQKHLNLSTSDVHMIGFSLGAHVAGFAGAELKNLSRITGLDPAGPLFESQDRRARLDSTDAFFVDVIHSNGENLILGGLGAWQPMGHVDFYPNGGRMQKGCTNLFVGAVSDMIWAANEVYGRSLCNHRRAYKFFTDSISLKCQFPAVPCESYDLFLEGKCFPCTDMNKCGNMGYYADKYNGTGKLYLLTRDEEPLCAHQYMIKVESSLESINSEKVVTYGKIQVMLIGDLELNETFTITQKKDEKLISGDVLSRIIVPHPALQNFYHIQLIYTAYNGWLSTGLKHWPISKVSLTDSYNQKLSVCKDGLLLESGVPFTLPLYPGDCVIHELAVNKIVNNTTRNESEDTTNDVQMLISDNQQEIVEEYNAYLKKFNDTDLLGFKNVDMVNDSWTPLYYYTDDSVQEYVTLSPYNCENCVKAHTVNNSFSNNLSTNDVATLCPLIQNVTDNNDLVSSAALYYNCIMGSRNGKKIDIADSTIGESYKTTAVFNISTLQPQQNYVRRSHNSKSIDIYGINQNSSYTNYLNPPLVEATESWRYWKTFPSVRTSRNITVNDNQKTNRSSGYFIIQFLPERLMSFLQKAENYVKLALVPYMTGVNDTSKYNTLSNQNMSRASENDQKVTWYSTNDSNYIDKRTYSARSSFGNKPINDTTVAFLPLVYSSHEIISNKKYIPLNSNEE